jgi:hypothetical protein
MFLRDLYSSAKRRWYFMLAGLVLTAGLAFWIFDVAPVSYEAKASVALIPPPTAVISGDNPFLYMGGLEQALGVLTVKLNSDSVRDPLEALERGSSYLAARDSSTTGPIVQVATEGPTADSALRTLNRALGIMPGEMTSLQDELALPEDARISLLVLAVDQEAALVDQGRTRTVMAAAAVGSVTTLLLTGLLDKLLLRRKSSKHPRRRPDRRIATLADTPQPRRRDAPLYVPEESSRGTRTPVTVPGNRG